MPSEIEQASSSSQPTPTRKAPPAPLSIPPSSLSPQSRASQGGASVSPHARNSLDSSRTDLTSLRISDFPTPPSVLPFLPTIPASPRTPRSLHFSTTPTTPRSQHAEFLQEPSSSKSLVPSPKAIKGFFTRSNNSLTKLTEQQDPSSVHVNEPSPSLHNRSWKEENDVEAYPYIISTNFEGSQKAYSPVTTRPETPAAPSEASGANSGRSSPLLSPNHQLGTSSRGTSPSRQPFEERSTRSPSLNPPRSPLPVPPSTRSSFRNSARFSQIMRQVGPIDMDISEEQLLSTDFISEMLRQPGMRYLYMSAQCISISFSLQALPLLNRLRRWN